MAIARGCSKAGSSGSVAAPTSVAMMANVHAARWSPKYTARRRKRAIKGKGGAGGVDAAVGGDEGMNNDGNVGGFYGCALAAQITVCHRGFLSLCNIGG